MSQWFWFWSFRFLQRRRIEITVETSESWDYQWSSENSSEVCPRCGGEIDVVPPDLEPEFVSVDSTALNTCTDHGRIHVSEDSTGDRLVSLKSLTRQHNTENENEDL